MRSVRRAFMANEEHQRGEPAAEDARIVTDLSGWLASAACCGSAWSLRIMEPNNLVCKPYYGQRQRDRSQCKGYSIPRPNPSTQTLQIEERERQDWQRSDTK